MPVALTIPCFLLIALAVGPWIGAGALASRFANDSNRGIVVGCPGAALTIAIPTIPGERGDIGPRASHTPRSSHSQVLHAHHSPRRLRGRSHRVGVPP